MGRSTCFIRCLFVVFTFQIFNLAQSLLEEEGVSRLKRQTVPQQNSQILTSVSCPPGILPCTIGTSQGHRPAAPANTNGHANANSGHANQNYHGVQGAWSTNNFQKRPPPNWRPRDSRPQGQKTFFQLYNELLEQGMRDYKSKLAFEAERNRHKPGLRLQPMRPFSIFYDVVRNMLPQEEQKWTKNPNYPPRPSASSLPAPQPVAAPQQIVQQAYHHHQHHNPAPIIPKQKFKSLGRPTLVRINSQGQVFNVGSPSQKTVSHAVLAPTSSFEQIRQKSPQTPIRVIAEDGREAYLVPMNGYYNYYPNSQYNFEQTVPPQLPQVLTSGATSRESNSDADVEPAAAASTLVYAPPPDLPSSEVKEIKKGDTSGDATVDSGSENEEAKNLKDSTPKSDENVSESNSEISHHQTTKSDKTVESQDSVSGAEE